MGEFSGTKTTVKITGALCVRARDSGCQDIMSFDFPAEYYGKPVFIYIGGTESVINGGDCVDINDYKWIITKTIGIGNHKRDYSSARVRFSIPDKLRGCRVVVVVIV